MLTEEIAEVMHDDSRGMVPVAIIREEARAVAKRLKEKHPSLSDRQRLNRWLLALDEVATNDH